MTFADIITSQAIAAYWTVRANERKPFFGESKFPAKKKLGLNLAWIKGARKSPVRLNLSAFDAKVLPLNRGKVTKLSTNMPFFKNSMVIDEEQRQELNKLIGSTANQQLIDIVVNDVFNDQMHLIEDAEVTMEILRMQALTTGVVSVADNGQSYSFDYGVPNENKVTPSVLWTNENADPIADITKYCDQIENTTGVRPTEGVMNNITLGYLTKVNAIKNAIYVMANGTVTPTRSKVLEYLQTETGVTFYINSKVYKALDGTSTKFVADGTVVLMPATTLGNTWFGTTPEESDLMSGATDANVSIVDTGVAITTMIEKDPVNVVTKASMICLPSFELAEQIIIATVK